MYNKNPRIGFSIDVYRIVNILVGLPLYVIKVPWAIVSLTILLIHCDFTQEFDRQFLWMETKRWFKFW